MKNKIKKLAALVPILSGVMWGMTGVFVRNLTAYGMDTYTVLGTRIIPGAFMLTIGILIYDSSLLKIKLKDFWIFAVASIVGTLGLNLCYNISIGSLTLSLAAVLLGMAPVFVLIFAAIFFREKITLKKTICMLAAIFGCVLVSGIFETSAEVQWSVPGIIIGILSALCYAMYSVMSKLAMERGYHALTITCYCLVINAVITAFLSDLNKIGGFVSEEPVKRIGFIILYAICVSVLPYVLYTLSFSLMDAGKASILASGEPVAAMVFGLIFFSEILTILMILGMVTAVSAMVVLGLPEKEREGTEENIASERLTDSSE